MAASDDDNPSSSHPRPFWSGVIAFGLVSLPVSLFPANRSKSFSLSMVNDEGVQLRRRYFCEKERKLLEREDIVRGFAVEKDRFVIIEDEELEALAPEKTREIDLRRFVPLEDVNPVFFERGYFLAPDSGATKAYRLLAKSMEEEQRVGIATFVMRDREYIIAIIAERGILRAETLRFHDEIRTPEQVGLPSLPDCDKKIVQEMRGAIEKLSEEKLGRDLLVEQEVKKARELVDKKIAQGTDVFEEAEEDVVEEESNVVDLMQVLKERLKGKGGVDKKKGADSDKARTSKSNGNVKTKPGGKKTSNKKSNTKAEADFNALNRDELYARAQKQHIDGRSKMTKNELVEALKNAG